jgi:hypothetical protein
MTITKNVLLSPSTVQGANVANIQITFLGFKLSSVNSATPVTLNSIPGGTAVEKLAFKLVGSSLYVGNPSPLDADGYPTTFNSIVIATKK